MQRTVCLSLSPTAEQASILLETSRQFTEAFNTVCAIGWQFDEQNGVALHHLTYRSLKSRLPDLVSDLHIQARVKATESLKSAFTRHRQERKTSCPHSAFCSPRYNIHTFCLNWADGTVRLSTTAGRIAVSFALPDIFAWATTGRVCTADLIKRDGRFFLHAVIETPTPVVKPNDTTIGVDLGVNRPAVTGDQQFLGERHWKEVEDRLFRRKRHLQAKRTKSSKRRLKILCGKQARFRRDCDHVLSKRIVDGVPPGGTVVLENLKDIRKRVRGRKGRQQRRLHGWSFAQLGGFVAYKAEAKGAQVALIDPRHTSQTCSRCGHQHRSNRKTQSLFKCRQCSFTLNADLNAARNVRAKHLGVFGIPLDVRSLSTDPTSLTTQGGGASAATRKPSRSRDDS